LGIYSITKESQQLGDRGTLEYHYARGPGKAEQHQQLRSSDLSQILGMYSRAEDPKRPESPCTAKEHHLLEGSGRAEQHQQPRNPNVPKRTEESVGMRENVTTTEFHPSSDQVYRVQGIPIEFERNTVASLLQSVLCLEESSTIEIRSLAMHHQKKAQVATVLFATTPSRLSPHPKSKMAD